MSNPDQDYIPEIEEFAKLLMQHVRDVAIQECDTLLTPRSRSPVARRWRKAAQTGSPEGLAKESIPDIVDRTLFSLLDAIDEGWLRPSYAAENGKVVWLNTGELAGWMGGGDGGWTVTYSKERFVDDFSHIENPPKS